MPFKAMKETSIGKRLQLVCKGWSQSTMYPRQWGRQEAAGLEHSGAWTSWQGLRWGKKKKEAKRKRGFWSKDATLRSMALEVVPLQVMTKSKV